MTAKPTASRNAVSSLETPAVIVTAIVSGQSIKAAMIMGTFIYHNDLKTSDVWYGWYTKTALPFKTSDWNCHVGCTVQPT